MSRSHELPHAFERCTGAATAPLPRGYRPRHPETTALYRVIADHVETMLQDARDRSTHGFGLPRHVERSFHRYLDCGVLARGFARVACPSCRYEVLVPFSCKTRHGAVPGVTMASRAHHRRGVPIAHASWRTGWTPACAAPASTSSLHRPDCGIQVRCTAPPPSSR